MLGLKRGAVKLVKYNSDWKKSFEYESKKIKKALGKDIVDIQHVGSTSIDRILAKPIIDIGVIVSSFQKKDYYIEKLSGIGYQFKQDDQRKERLFFYKGSESKRTYYLHMGEAGKGYVEEMILFRDYLRNNRETAQKYSELKSKLALRYKNKREIYTAKKEKLIKEIIEEAHRSSTTKTKK